MTETFPEYTARLLSLSADADPFEVLASTPSTIGAWIAGRGAKNSGDRRHPHAGPSPRSSRTWRIPRLCSPTASA